MRGEIFVASTSLLKPLLPGEQATERHYRFIPERAIGLLLNFFRGNLYD